MKPSKNVTRCVRENSALKIDDPWKSGSNESERFDGFGSETFSLSQVDESGKIVELTEGGCPWKDHLFDIEDELGIQGELTYVIFSDHNNSYRVQCVPVNLGSFDNR